MTEEMEPAVYRKLVQRALKEDLGTGDITSEAVVETTSWAKGRILSKSTCILAGLEVVTEVCRQIDSRIRLTCQRSDGDSCVAGEVVVNLSGAARSILAGERTALNFLQRLSGIATLTRAFVDASAGALTVLDTRKTTPTLRRLEKYAVRVGGGSNHRFALDDGVLIKDNHIVLTGGVAAALDLVRGAKLDKSIEVEVDTVEEADDALEAGADRLLVDNMTDADVREVVLRSRGRAEIEISGGVTLKRMPGLVATGADYVSVGALTHSAPSVDFSLELELSDH